MNLTDYRLDDLQGMPFSEYRWVCRAEGCKNHAKLRDYGSFPLVFWKRKQGLWVDVSRNNYICSKHFRMFRKKERFILKDKVPSTQIVITFKKPGENLL